MHRIFGLIRYGLRRSIERERAMERHFEAASRSLWPWNESKLIAFVSFLAVLDYISTYAFLELSGNKQLFEVGPLARWAFQTGGFYRLFWVDIAAICTLIFLANSVRFLYAKFGFQGFGRTAFVFVLVPYSVITMAIIFNNVVLTFL